MISRLCELNIIQRAESGAWLLSRDLDEVTLAELYEGMALRVPTDELYLPARHDAIGRAASAGARTTCASPLQRAARAQRRELPPMPPSPPRTCPCHETASPADRLRCCCLPSWPPASRARDPRPAAAEARRRRSQPPRDHHPGPGKAKPEFPTLVVETFDGGTFDLAEHRGKWVVVNFWATWCNPCLKEIPDLDAFDKAREDVRGDRPGLRGDRARRHGGLPQGASRSSIRSRSSTSTSRQPDFDTPRGLPMTYLIAPDGKVAERSSSGRSPRRSCEATSKRPAPRRCRSDMSAARFLVRGKVQGVWFRAATREQAERLQICGATRATCRTAASKCWLIGDGRGDRRRSKPGCGRAAAGESHRGAFASHSMPTKIRRADSSPAELLSSGPDRLDRTGDSAPFRACLSSAGKTSVSSATFVVGQAVEQVADQVEPAALLVVEIDHRPGRVLGVRGREHRVARLAVFGVFLARLEVDRRQLPALERIGQRARRSVPPARPGRPPAST